MSIKYSPPWRAFGPLYWSRYVESTYSGARVEIFQDKIMKSAHTGFKNTKQWQQHLQRWQQLWNTEKYMYSLAAYRRNHSEM